MSDRHETTGQRTDAAERSAHVLRAGDAPQPAREIFAGPEFGPMRLRVVADLEAENARLREALAGLVAAHDSDADDDDGDAWGPPLAAARKELADG